MLTRNAINRVYAANGGHVARHKFGDEPLTPTLPLQTQPEEEQLSEKPAAPEDHQPPS